MNVSLKQSKHITELASLLYDFLPGSGAIYTFANAAEYAGVKDYWIGGSKLPAIQNLLEKTFSEMKESFKPLILNIVKEGLKYRNKKGSPLTRQEIEKLNSILDNLRIEIPELNEKEFLNSLENSNVEINTTNGYLKLFNSLSIHPKIVNVSRKLFSDGHYSQAIFEAFKAVNNFVKEKSGCSDFDGQSLMSKVFNENKPVLKLNSLQAQSDIDEQHGFKFLYMGAMTGIRNPKAHENIQLKDAIRALKYIAFASLLLERAMESEKSE